MAFYFSLDHQKIAYQVAALINCYNQLSAKKSVSDVLCGRTNYITETHGKLILGAVGMDRQSYTFTEIKHLVVHPEWRGKGIAKHLLRRALDITNTKMIYATVREDNEASLKLFESFGFNRAGNYETEDHAVVLLVRVSAQWQQIKSGSKSKSWNVEALIEKMVSSTPTSLKSGKTRSERTG